MRLSKFIALVMVTLFLITSVVPVYASPAVSSVVPGHIYVPKGTIIKAELVNGVNSGKNQVNDVILFKTTESIVINGVEVIPRGTTGEAVVSKVSKAGYWGKGGKVELAAKSIKTLNSIEVPLTSDVSKAGGGANMVLGVIAIGIFSGFLHGKDQDIPAGTKFNVAVESDTDLGVDEEQLAGVMKKSKVVTVTVQ